MTPEHKLKMQQGRERRRQIDAYYKGLEEQRRAANAKEAGEQRKRESESRVRLILTDKERKLLNLALNPASTENEWQTALIKFGESLRSRNEVEPGKVVPMDDNINRPWK
jgi:hypothetical protein